jgi:hypothetical protein
VHSTLALRVNQEIKEEHNRLIAECRSMLMAKLDSMSLSQCQEGVCAGGGRAPWLISSWRFPHAKKVKVVLHKAHLSPITPQGWLESISSITSAQTHKQVYSPSEVVVANLLPLRGDMTLKQTHTIMFPVKQEQEDTTPCTSPAPFITLPTLSVIWDAVNFAEDISLHSSTTSMHNPANQM